MFKLTPRLARSVVSLKNAKGQLVHVIGTAHVSQQSCDDVRELIAITKPSAVFVELCKQREKALDSNFDSSEASDLSTRETIERYKNGDLNGFTLMYSIIMKYYDLKPGKEFIAAAESAAELQVPIVLGDRLMGITVKRIWMGMTFWQKASLVRHFLSGSDVEEGISLEEDDLNKFVQDRQAIKKEMDRLAKLSPWLVESLINERDKFMVLELEQTLEELGEGNIVAVVGAGHLDGIEKFWNERAMVTRDEEFHTKSNELHYQLQFYPGMPEENFTKADLRRYAAQFSKQQ